MNSPLFIAGIDEAGRGPLAGPLSVAGIILPVTYMTSSITDSKKISAKNRLSLFHELKEIALAYSCLLVEPAEIDQINIFQATKQGMRRVAQDLVEKISTQNQTFVHFLVDGNTKFCNEISNEAIIKGDGKIKCIGAASILAKVTRDLYMEEMSNKYPDYAFEKHKGYPTKLHKERIKQFGPCPIHRKTFSGVKEYYSEEFNERSGQLR